MSLLSTSNSHFCLTSPLFKFISRNEVFLSSSQQFQCTHLNFHRGHCKLLPLFSVSAANSRRRKGGTEVIEMSDSDSEDGADFDFGDYGDNDDGDDEEGMFLPLGKMKRWLENKPRGFGEDKVYDTSIEDKLLEEIGQSRQAQVVNINKLKNEPVKNTGSKKQDGITKESEVIPSGIRVRLVNLPKKKNIHRDLKDAFEGVPGIISISPAVSGNKKTRDPICKGFGFVYFKSEEYATRFMQTFSNQSVSFGKVQKQIKCEMLNSQSSMSADELSANNTDRDTKITVSGSEEDPSIDSDTGDADNETLNSLMEVTYEGSLSDGEFDPEELEDIRENLESISLLELNVDNKMQQDRKPVIADRRKKNRSSGKKVIDKGNVKKVAKLEAPGSAKRLKVKEKAVLTDVFSKYGAKASVATKKES